MAGINIPIKLSKKTEVSGEKFSVLIILLFIFSTLLILVFTGKLLYDKTLETAEAENAVINRSAAAALDIFFSGMGSASTALLETVNAPGFNRSIERVAVDAFFENNNNIAALSFYDSSDKNAPPLSFINQDFFKNNSIDVRLVNIFVELTRASPEGSGRTRNTVLNCESIFGIPLLAMVFQHRGGATGLVFFHLAGLEEVFKTDRRTSYLVNTADGVLLHSGGWPPTNGENVFRRTLIQPMLSSLLNSGRLRYVNGEGRRTTGAYSKLNAVPVLFITEMTYRAVLGELAAVALRVGCAAAGLVFFLALVVLFLTRYVRISLEKLTEFDEVKRKLEAASRFADMRLVRKILDGTAPAVAEYKNVTVMLSGIESFANIAERLNPGDSFALLNKYISRAACTVKKTNGVLDQFSDGNVRAHWGALSSSGNIEHDTLNCIRCALMLRVAVYELNRELSPSGEPACIKLSCGISSGEFAAGIADCGGRAAYTLIGKNGGFAETAKAQNMACNTDILITENTWRLVQKYILVHEMRPLKIEGRPNPLRLFALVNLRTVQGEAQVFPATLLDVRSLYPPKRPAGESETGSGKYNILEF
ncbi:MAG: adenylate/guanylate cyclase domain-containing protein [Spirochaetaceae bacterium]|jgi:adenylate cyclase|nr:adenylate/guanylate cyclase domain-containing protein [Spirochaetaceae bacterium]